LTKPDVLRVLFGAATKQATESLKRDEQARYLAMHLDTVRLPRRVSLMNGQPMYTTNVGKEMFWFLVRMVGENQL